MEKLVSCQKHLMFGIYKMWDNRDIQTGIVQLYVLKDYTNRSLPRILCSKKEGKKKEVGDQKCVYVDI